MLQAPDDLSTHVYRKDTVHLSPPYSIRFLEVLHKAQFYNNFHKCQGYFLVIMYISFGF